MIDFWTVNRYGTAYKMPDYIRFVDKEVPSRYDSNGMVITTDITKEQLLVLAEEQLATQAHVKFTFPPDITVPMLEDYELSELEIYELTTPMFAVNEAITVQFVDATTVPDFLRLSYDEALPFGEKYAKEREAWLCRKLQQDFVAVIAYYQNEAVGAVELIVQENTVELDQFFVREAFQRQGIGSTIQAFIEAHFLYHTIFLVADASDTPREMYQRQGYDYCATFYELTKQPPSL